MTTSMKRLGWALAVSLGLNVFLIGFESARWFERRAHSSEHAPPPGEGAGVPRFFGPPGPELKAQRAEIGAARREVGEALVAEPFDRERLARALDELHEKTSAGQKLMHQRMVERAASLTPQQRKAFAQSRLFRGGPMRR